MIEVVVTLVEGGMPSTAVAPVEIFGCAGRLWNEMRGLPAQPPFRVRTAAHLGRPVRTGVRLTLTPDCDLVDVETADLVIVSAIGANVESGCAANQDLYPWLRHWYRQGAVVAGVCAGVALVAEAGLLDGRPATTHWGVAEACRRRFPQVDWHPERFLTESGNVLCSGGVYASVDLSLYLVEKYCGHQVAMETAQALLLETPRTWQSGYALDPPRISHEDSPVRRVQDWLFRHFCSPVKVEDLARRAAMTKRTFARRFKAATGETPMNYLHQLRINAARHMLENSSLTVQEVSQAVGYQDPVFFRQIFRRHTDQTPRQYRDHFGVDARDQLATGARFPHR
ncbi:GlxA family transcriptional regulator [Marinobacter zhanjiangensis]|uniref:AraC family transcriptional regulator n=1 Tax=Marinobacter zhanjiangensis TaxID=578215 RepID=A0ABQ3AQW6_9GAMM|nr:helix-turn-helix domain-containing protein [Marinobacter zhanjiangensis]GGY61222.1 AraC family transcriptional regulator [Marinobacter zhanjiangensis]